MGILSREATLSVSFVPPFELGSTLKEKDLQRRPHFGNGSSAKKADTKL